MTARIRKNKDDSRSILDERTNTWITVSKSSIDTVYTHSSTYTNRPRYSDLDEPPKQ